MKFLFPNSSPFALLSLRMKGMSQGRRTPAQEGGLGGCGMHTACWLEKENEKRKRRL